VNLIYLKLIQVSCGLTIVLLSSLFSTAFVAYFLMRGGSKQAPAMMASLIYVSGLMTSDFDLIVERICPPSHVKKFQGIKPIKIDKKTWYGLMASICAKARFISQLGDPGNTLRKVK
jgi:hypothetical protein